MNIYGENAFNPSYIKLYFPHISSALDSWESGWNAYNCPVFWNQFMPTT